MRPWITAILLLAPTLTGCINSPLDEADDGPVVYATFYPLQYFTSRLLGPDVTVRTLVPPGAEPHDYEPGPRDVAGVTQARAFVHLGHGFEPWLDRLLASAATPHLALVNATQGVDLAGAEAETHDEHDAHDEPTPANATPHDNGTDEGHEGHVHDLAGIDSHVWLDPILAQDVAAAIAHGLTQAFPDLNTTIQTNLRNLTSDLQTLATHYETGLAYCNRDAIIVSHNAYARLGERYHFELLSLSGLSPEAEPSPQRLRELADYAQEHGIRIVFKEPLVSSRPIEALAREIDGEVRTLNPIDGLTPEEQAAGLDYFDLQHQNLDALTAALECL